jgi:hypothetical protein
LKLLLEEPPAEHFERLDDYSEFVHISECILGEEKSLYRCESSSHEIVEEEIM